MSKQCECCGKRNSFFVCDEFYIAEEKILCNKCAEFIKSDLNAINYVKTNDEYNNLKNKIIVKCRQKFNDTTTAYICALIEKRYNSLEFVKKEENTKTKTVRNNSSVIFGDIGGKIKALATVIAWIGIVASVISGFTMMSIDEDLIFAGILVLGLGSLVSWISSFVFFGFGQLVENIDKLVEILNKQQ